RENIPLTPEMEVKWEKKARVLSNSQPMEIKGDSDFQDGEYSFGDFIVATPPPVTEQIGGGEKKFDCLNCGKQYAHRSGLSKHKKVCSKKQTEYGCALCKRTFTSSTLLANHQKKCGMKFECDSCGNCFDTKQNLVDHITAVHGSNSFECEICNNAFGS